MKTKLQYRLEFFGLLIASQIIVRLPYAALRHIARTLAEIAFLLDGRGRAVALANLESAFPAKYSAREKRSITRRSYATFARTMLELCWAPNLTEDFVRKQCEFRGLELNTCRTDPTQPAIYTGFHFGNFEWLALVGAYTIAPGPIIAQRFRNPLLGPVFDKLRTSTGNHVIPQERAMLRMLKYLRGGGKFGMTSDLNLDPREGSVLVECFGGLLASVTQAHAALAQRTGAVLVPVDCRPLPGGRYLITHHPAIVCPPEADVCHLVQLCWNALEPAVHEHPECWLWPYKHWRFAPEKDRPRYPFYANTAGRFEKLVTSRTVSNG